MKRILFAAGLIAASATAHANDYSFQQQQLLVQQQIQLQALETRQRQQEFCNQQWQSYYQIMSRRNHGVFPAPSC
jgi:hypothetical protein